MILPRFLILLFASFPLAVNGHEFWIDAERYQIEVGDKLQANFKIGEGFRGGNHAFFDRSSARYEMIIDGKTFPITPRSGDTPALDIPAPPQDGLAVVVHETTDSFVTYREWEKFLKFARHKDFAKAGADHKAAGWSQEKFRERYTRHAKALFAIGTGVGADVAAGLTTEFVAQTNPYAPSFDNQMRVRLFYQGAPRPNAQVEVFAKVPGKEAEITLHRTDAQGVAVIPVKPGHQYLFDAVVLRPDKDAGREENAIVWQTFWAALTFEVPK